MRNNDVSAQHLGGGVILFENALSFDSDWVTQFSEEQVSKERNEMYTPTVHPETGEPAFLNKSGYLFDAEGVDMMPRRGSAIHRTEDPQVHAFLDFIEASKDRYLLKYFMEFPIAYKNVWWKVKGHLVSYSTTYGGKFLGSHSDTSADYLYGYAHPADQLATRNTLTSLVYLNDNFTGGHHYFNYLGIDYVPNEGDILMFPSNFMASHEVTPIVNGSRYTYLGWYAHGSPNSEVNEHIVDPLTQPELAITSTNVYMPTLTDDFYNYMVEIKADPQFHGWSLVESINS
jgi:hypothetical protein